MSTDCSTANKIELFFAMSDAWWYDNYGIVRGKEYYEDAEHRIRLDMERERLLFDRFGDFGIGNKDPQPSPTIVTRGSNPVGEMYGMEYVFKGRDGVWPVAMDLDDDAIFALRPIHDVSNMPLIEGLMNQMAYIEREYGWRWMCTTDWWGTTGVMNAALDIRGYQFLADLADAPELARHLLSIITQSTANYLDWQCGVWGRRPRYMGIGNCSDTMISPQTYLDFVFACDEWLSAKYEGIGIHRDDNLDPYLDAYLMHPKLVGADCGWDSDIAEVRKKLPAEKYRLNLRLDPYWLARAAPAEIIGRIHQHIEDAGEPFSQFALVTDNYDSSVSDANVAAVLEAVRA